jgi:cytochrome P450
MTGDEPRNWFADESLAQDPYPFLAGLRSQCPVQPTPHHDVVAVTGYEEASEVLRRHDDFSACVTVAGPFAGFPEPLAGDDVSELIERHRHRLLQLRADLDAPVNGGIAHRVRPMSRGRGRLTDAGTPVDRRPYPRLR